MRTSINIMISTVVFVMMLSVSHRVNAESIRVAAAANLKFALEEIAANFTKETNHQVVTTYGSSGLLSTQIKHGAPFQLFMSADESYVQDVHAKGLTIDEGVVYALGRIVIVAPKGSKLKLDARLEGLSDAIKNQTLSRFSIASPIHAPYGKLAQQALQNLGLWQSIQPYLVFGENISQAAQFATSGSADGGIIALSLVKSPQLEAKVDYVLLPENLHLPLKQRMALTKLAGPAAKDFYQYLQQPLAKDVFKRYGFDFPEGAH